MPFPFRLMRISGTVANSLVALALQAHADELQPPRIIAGTSEAAQEAPLDPTDQGASTDDARISRGVRQTLTHDGALSSDAQRVRIITRDGVVTLQGQVKSAAAKTAVAAAAKRIDGVKRVDDQLQLGVDPR
jgi:osmotically-inducible protein OsmY